MPVRVVGLEALSFDHISRALLTQCVCLSSIARPVRRLCVPPAVTTESRSFLASANTPPARGLTTPPLLSAAAGCPNSSLRSLYTYTPTPTPPHSHPFLFAVVIVTESRGSRLRGSVGLCSQKPKTPPAQLQYLSELQSVRLPGALLLRQKGSLDSFKSNLRTFVFAKQYTCHVFRSALLYFLHRKSLVVICLSCL